MEKEPRFTHDCEGCTFLGADDRHDFYFCTQGGGLATLLARYGNKAHEYESGLAAAKYLEREDPKHPLVTALGLARNRYGETL